MNGVGLSKPKSVDNNHNWLILLNFISEMRKIEMSPAQCRLLTLLRLFYNWLCDRVLCINGKSRAELPSAYEGSCPPLNPMECAHRCPWISAWRCVLPMRAPGMTCA